MFYCKLISIIFVSCVPFLFTLNGDFVFDDSEAIIKNKDVTSRDWRHAFIHDYWGTDIQSSLSHKSYRPLTILSFKLNYLLSDYKLIATHFKITNLLCHIFGCLLVWLGLETVIHTTELKCRYKRKIDLAYLAALLFSSHPVHVEAVSGIVGRADLLAAITFFMSLYFYNLTIVDDYDSFYNIFTIIGTTVSMLFKESGVTVLGLCIILELIAKWKYKKVERIPNQILDTDPDLLLSVSSYKRLVIIFFAIISLLQLRWIIMAEVKPTFNPTDNPAYFSDSLFTKVLTYNYIYFINAVILVWPQWLCYDWSMGCIPLIKSIRDPRILAVVVIYLYGYQILRTVCLVQGNEFNKRILVMAVSFVIIPFLPASNIFYPVGFVIAERILYIPSAGYCLLISLGINRIIEIGKGKLRKITMAFFIFVVAMNGLRSWNRSHDWQTEYKLFVSGLSVCPLNAKVHYNVAKVADAMNNTEWALSEYQEAIRLYPEYYQAMNNLGNLYKSQKNYKEAEFHLKDALRHKRDFPTAWMNLGIILASTGRPEKALKAYQTALHYRNNYADCFYNLGNLYLEMNKTDDAMSYWIKAIKINSTHVLAWTNFLALLDNTGQISLASELIPKALKYLPESAPVNFAIANIYGKMELYEDAERFFKKAIMLFGENVQAIHYANLGVLYHRWKKYQLGEKMYSKALEIDPNFKSARKNLLSLKKSVSM